MGTPLGPKYIPYAYIDPLGFQIYPCLPMLCAARSDLGRGWLGSVVIRPRRCNFCHIGIMENKMETTIVYWGYIGIMENKMETTIVYWGYIGIMENKMETTIVYWGYIGIMKNKMETTMVYSSKALQLLSCKR